jgi:hypothetical protein
MSKIISLLTTALLYSTSLLAQVEGEVVGPNGIGIAKAILTATDSTGRLIDTTMTDKRGFYCFKTLKPGQYSIEARAEGFIPDLLKNIVVKKEFNRTNERDDTYYAIRLDITLTPSKLL